MLVFIAKKIYKKPFIFSDLKKRWSKKSTNKLVGDFGENVAGEFLKYEKNFKILYRNYRAMYGGEVDIVCRDSDVLVFVEVKTRRLKRECSDGEMQPWAYGVGFEAVDYRKQGYIIRGAVSWLRLLKFPEINFRFDVIEVLLREGELPVVSHAKNVFQVPNDYFI